jgi:hypothetical protein
MKPAFFLHFCPFSGLGSSNLGVEMGFSFYCVFYRGLSKDFPPEK